MAKKKVVTYISYHFPEYKCRLFWMYVDGVWDEDKRTYEDAIEAYPKDKWGWVKIKETY